MTTRDLSRVLAQVGIGCVPWNGFEMSKTSFRNKSMTFFLSISHRQRH